MSLDVYLMANRRVSVFEQNITHNLNKMADAAGIYFVLWRPYEIGLTKAEQLIAPLEAGLALMKADPDKFKALEPENKWGTYRNFLPWIEKYIQACKDNPDAEIEISR